MTKKRFGAALFTLLMVSTTEARADGESTPMFGLAAVGGESQRTREHIDELGGIALDLVWWHWRFGLAAEGSARWSTAGAREFVLGGSARFRLLDGMSLALMDTRQVEVALELQAIVERTWTGADTESDPVSHGLGLALRVRGAGEPEGTSVLAESRFFVRVMASRWSDAGAVARTAMPSSPAPPPPLTVLVGIGASFGEGTSSYMVRFRSHPFGPSILW